MKVVNVGRGSGWVDDHYRIICYYFMSICLYLFILQESLFTLQIFLKNDQMKREILSTNNNNNKTPLGDFSTHKKVE